MRTEAWVISVGYSDVWAGFLFDAAANMVGALVGALLAIPTGLWIDRRRSASEREERSIIALKAINEELERNLQSLAAFCDETSHPSELHYPKLNQDSWKAAQEMRLLVGIRDYDLYKRLVEVYEKIDFVSELSKSLWQLFFTPGAEFTFLEERLLLLRTALIDESKQLSEDIAKVLKDTLRIG